MITKLTASEFIKKFPDTERNTNCLEDVACPECGNRGKFQIQVTTMMEVLDDGTDSTSGDVEWDEKSLTVCQQCAARGVLDDFTIEGLDDALEEKE